MFKSRGLHFSDNFVEEVRRKITLSSVVREYCQLHVRAGRVLGRCPFHEEKTPSFYVDDDKGLYYCFGCSAKGDVFQFYMSKKGVSFPQSVEELAIKAGVPLPIAGVQEQKRYDSEQKQCAQMHALMDFYEDVLWNRPEGSVARDYLKKRGFTEKTCREFHIGFSPPRGAKTAKEWMKKGWDMDVLRAVGNAVRGSDGSVYDRFFGRLMFPVFDVRERVIAFSGRVLPGQKYAKYMNSPETALFHKKYTVYNAPVLRKRRNELFFVEGFTDVMRLHQVFGVAAVSPMGTAISEHQVQALWRSCAHPQVLLDGDLAGKSAVERLVHVALPHIEPDKTLIFAFIPNGQDPDAYFFRGWPGALRALPHMTFDMYLWEQLSSSIERETPEAYAALEEKINAVAGCIKHTALRKHYRTHLFRHLYQRMRTVNKSQVFVPKGVFGAHVLQQKILLASLCVEPSILDTHDEAIASVRYTKSEWSHLVSEALLLYETQGDLTSRKLVKYLIAQGAKPVLKDIYDRSLRTHASFLFQRNIPERKDMIQRVVGDITRLLLMQTQQGAAPEEKEVGF